MTGKGHHAVGIGAALMSYAALIGRGYEEPMALIAAWAVLPGATAPDWLEISRGGGKKRRPLITHRTLTSPIGCPYGSVFFYGHTIRLASARIMAGLLLGVSVSVRWFICWWMFPIRSAFPL